MKHHRDDTGHWGSPMANKRHLGTLKQGVEAWNKWRKENPAIKPNLRGAYLVGAQLAGVDLRRTDLVGVDLSGAYLIEADLELADFFRANLSNAYLWGADLTLADLTMANLRGADLSGAYLNGTHLPSAQLNGANLNEAHLRGVDLSVAQLRGAYLTRAGLQDADLNMADLCDAELYGADLSGADLSDTDLRRANFEEVSIGGTKFGNTDLSDTRSLDTVKHAGPSTIGLDTIIKSAGKIPESFLRGAGVPDNWIAYIPSLLSAMQPIQFYSCFISYTTKDQEIAERLHNDLRAKGVRVWFAPQDMKTGDPIRQRIDDTIRIYDKLIVILSANSLSSAWVQDEVETAYDKERQTGKTVLFPLRLDDTVAQSPQAWAAKLWHQRHITDFRDWHDPAAYQAALSRLIRDLNKPDKEPSTT